MISKTSTSVRMTQAIRAWLCRGPRGSKTMSEQLELDLLLVRGLLELASREESHDWSVSKCVGLVAGATGNEAALAEGGGGATSWR